MFNPSKAQAKNESEPAKDSGDNEDFSGSGDKGHSYYSKPLKSTRNPPIMIRMPEEASKKADKTLIIVELNSNNENVPHIPENFGGNITGSFTPFIKMIFFTFKDFITNFIFSHILNSALNL